jgi:hypothetical protein
MAGGRARRGSSAEHDEALTARWAEAVRAGSPPEELTNAVLAAPLASAAASVRRLGGREGDLAIPYLAELVTSGSAPLGEAAAEALGDVRTQAAADALETLAHATSERAVQKALRRSLHRLSNQGIRPQTEAPAPSVNLGARTATLYRVLASSYDGRGQRALWFAAERPMGGIYMIGVSIDAAEGLIDCVGRDTTRKRFAEQEAEMRGKDLSGWVELPIEYGKQLVQEAVGLCREHGHPVPTTYPIWAELIGAPEQPFERGLVYEELSAFEMRMHPTLENESPQLFEQPEIEPWFFHPDQMRKWLRELSQPATSRLIVTTESQEQRVERIFRQAAKELLPARQLHGLRRRLEETAYIFLRTGRAQDARRAVAAAATIEEERPLRPPHPFVRALIERSLDIAVEVERSGFEPMRLARAT